MRLVESSVPGAVERDAALRLLSERAVLTRMLCRELAEARGRLPDRRVSTALSILLIWIGRAFPHPSGWEPRPTDGLDKLAVSEEGGGLLAEVRDGALVADALYLYMYADSTADKAVLSERLASYWTKHGAAVRPPWFIDDKWPSEESDDSGTRNQ